MKPVFETYLLFSWSKEDEIPEVGINDFDGDYTDFDLLIEDVNDFFDPWIFIRIVRITEGGVDVIHNGKAQRWEHWEGEVE